MTFKDGIFQCGQNRYSQSPKCLLGHRSGCTCTSVSLRMEALGAGEALDSCRILDFVGFVLLLPGNVTNNVTAVLRVLMNWCQLKESVTT